MDKCPACNSGKIWIIDKGIKKIVRFLQGNNRFACHDCYSTWREKMPHKIMKIRRTHT